LLIKGLTITIVGMAIVFVFLILLVLSMIALHQFVKRLFPKTLQPKTQPEPKLPARSSDRAQKQDITGEVAAAVAAIKSYALKG
jgi:sodium pump decarboxylase gamma subunit